MTTFYVYQTVEATTSPDDDSIVTGVHAVGSLLGSPVKAHSPKPGAPVKPPTAWADRKPGRWVATDAPAIARFKVTDAGTLTRWASTPDASERLALLMATGVEPTYSTSPLSPTNAALATFKSIGAVNMAAMTATGGFVVPSERGAKSASTAGKARAATASERNEALLAGLFADADAPSEPVAEPVKPAKPAK